LTAFDLFWHVANFIAPALGMGAICAGLCKLAWRRRLARVTWFELAWQSSVAGLAVLVTGLVVTRHDGRMVTYVALVAVCAGVPWWKTLRT
jgi:hypothetical protein